ncbi:MAG: cytochrome c biogenesis protein CcdA [Candidatus Liptonbacteria bacterium]|nr:cytochrome c biogenesis protein CcdA [Candidatus Liptonbacteria bacterium]
MTNFFKNKLVWLGIVAAIVIGLAIFFGSTSSAPFIWNVTRGGTWLLPLLVIAAIADSINPCAFSILIITIALLVSMGKLRSGILKIGGAYIFGIFAVYVLIGLGILQALHIFNTPHFMAKVGATLLIVLGGINVINDFFPSFPIKLRSPQVAHSKIAILMEKASIPTAFLLGALVGLCEFPCTGGPYLMVLGLLHDNATFVSGLGYLVVYNLIFILPLVVILLIASEKTLLGKVQEWKKAENRNMRLWGGIAMVLLGFLIFAL